jgi:hypothetical protein
MKYTKRRLNDSTTYALWLDLCRPRGGARHYYGGGLRQRQRYEPHTNHRLRAARCRQQAAVGRRRFIAVRPPGERIY